MKEKEDELKKREDIKIYLEQINWDWILLKGQLILGGILVVGLILYFWLEG